MSQRRVHSQGNVPFAWEAKPGVSKVANKPNYPKESTFPSLKSKPSSPPPLQAISEDLGEKKIKNLEQNEMKIPLPPGWLKAPIGSASVKGLKLQAASEEDPFLVAFKVCTRTTSATSHGVDSSQGNKFVVKKHKRGSTGLIGSKLKHKYSVFSCKNDSCEVREGNFVNIPPIPRERIRI